MFVRLSRFSGGGCLCVCVLMTCVFVFVLCMVVVFVVGCFGLVKRSLILLYACWNDFYVV